MRRNLDVDVVDLQDATDVGLVRRPAAQLLQRSVLVAERGQEGIGGLGRVERLVSKMRYGFFNLDGVHCSAL